jgi:S1-C subfamily serine protease
VAARQQKSKGVSVPDDVWDATSQALHERTLYPTIRVRSSNAMGSGTIIYCGDREEADEDGEFGHSTYALTNHHVVESAITVEKYFDPQEGKNITRDYRDFVQVEAFDYKNWSTITGRVTAEVEIVAYLAKRDLALLRFRTNRKFEYTAHILPADDAKKIRIYDKLFLVGCGMGQPPFPTSGMLTGKDVQIDNYPYWQTEAPSIFGNSGGAVFRGATLEFIGVPSRISVSGGMFTRDAITHIGYFCPPAEIHKFLHEQGYHFIVDDTHTEAQDLKALAEATKGEDDEDE